MWLDFKIFWRRPKTRTEIEEEKFILAANRLKTLQVPLGGCISIDPEEIRDQIIAGREEYKSLVRRDGQFDNKLVLLAINSEHGSRLRYSLFVSK